MRFVELYTKVMVYKASRGLREFRKFVFDLAVTHGPNRMYRATAAQLSAFIASQPRWKP